MLNSCQLDQEFEYNDEFPGSRLVLQAFMNENGIFAEIRKTLSPLKTNSPDSVSEAIVSLYENNFHLFDLIKKDSYIYHSPETFNPDKNNSYHIVVNAEGYETIQSTAQSLPPKVLIYNCKYVEYHNYTIVYTTFEDPPDIGNAYYIGYIIYLNNEILLENSFIDPFDVFNDNDFNNRTYTREKEMYIKKYEFDHANKTDTILTADSAKILLYSLSPDFYSYMYSFEKYELSNRSPVYEQPFQVFSNIINGYGIFGAYSIDSCKIVFDKKSN